MSDDSNSALPFTNQLVLAGSLLLSFILGAAIVLFGLSAIGLGRYTTGAAGQVSGIAGGLAGLLALFVYLSYQYYQISEG